MTGDVTSSLVRRMIAAARDLARTQGTAHSIAIVDSGGVLKGLLQMDGASVASVRSATKKAYTAAGFRMPTDMWYDFIKGDPPLRLGAPSGIEHLVIFGGGYPITDGAAGVIGGIGVSGGDWRSDMAIAEAGLSQLGGGASVARRMAEYVAGDALGRPPTPSDYHHAVRAIINALGGALAALGEPAVASLIDWEHTTGPGESSGGTRVLWSPLDTAVDRAALINGTLLHLVDFDDTHLSTVIHATSPVLAVLLAQAQGQPVRGVEFLDAFIAGVEAEVTVGAMLMPSHYMRGFHVTAIAGTVGAAVAAGRMMNLSVDKMTTALGIAVNSASGFKENFGSMTKAIGVGNAARSGLVAAQLARAGISAAETVFEGSSGLTRATTDVNASRAYGGLSILGTRSFVADLALKRFPTGVAMHAPLDAALELRNSLPDGDLAEVRSITLMVDPLVEEHWRVATGLQQDGRDLTDPLEAKFSLKYCVSFAWTHGHFDTFSMDESSYSDEDVLATMQRVELVADQRVTLGGCRMRVLLADGSEHESVVMHHRGTPANRVSDDEISTKFIRMYDSAGLGSQDEAEVLLEQLWSMHQSEDVSAICRDLSMPPR